MFKASGAALTASLLTVLSVSACSSSGSPASPAGGGGGPGPNGPIVVGFISRLTNPQFAFPEVRPAAQAAVDALNAAGGIHHHKVVLDVCDDQGNPNIAASCAGKMVSSQVTAVLLGYTNNSQQIEPVLQTAGVPYVDPVPHLGPDLSSSVSFPPASGDDAENAGDLQAMKTAGCKQPGVATYSGLPDATSQFPGIDRAASKLGFPAPVIAAVPYTTVDLSSEVATLSSKGVDCTMLILAPTHAVQIVNAVHQQAPSMKLFSNNQAFGPAVIAGLPAAETQGMILYGAARQVTDNNPEVSQFKAQMAKYSPGAKLDEFSMNSWAAAKFLFAALDKVQSSYSASSVRAALGGLTMPLGTAPSMFGTDIFGPFATAHASSVPGSPRLFNANVFGYVVRDKAEVPLPDQPINTAALLG